MAAKRAPGVELVPVDQLEHHPANPRQGDVGAIVSSIEANGWWGVVVAQASTRRVLAGNHRLKAARALGMTAVPVHWVDVDDATALRVLLADNRSNDLASYDDAALADLLRTVLDDAGTLDGTLYDGDDLDQLLADLDPVAPAAASDDTPPLPVEAKTRLGDVFDLGPHRLVCGDSTDADVWARLLDGDDEAPALMVTDPPYGVGYDPQWRAEAAPVSGLTGTLVVGATERDRIEGDAQADWRDVYALCTAPIAYAWHAASKSREAAEALESAGYEIRQQIVWVKPNPVLARAGYHYRHEPCWYAVRSGHTAAWTGDRTETTVWESVSPLAPFGQSDPNDGRTSHPTQKPAVLYEKPIRNHTTRGQIVVDPFGGSGTLIVAADRSGRRARLIELDPAYCDVIRQRYADHANRPDLAP